MDGFADGFAVFGLFSVRRRWIYRSVEASKFMATCYSSLPSSFGKSSLWGICFKCLGCLKFLYILFNLVVGENVEWQPLAWNTSISSCQEKKTTQVASLAEMHLTSHGMIHFWMLPWDFPWVGRKFPRTTSIHKFSFLFRGSPASNMSDISKYLSRGWCGLWIQNNE